MVDVLITPASGTIKMDDATSVTPDGRTPGADRLWASGSSLYWGAHKLNNQGGGGGGIGGSIANTQIAYGNGTDIAGSANLTYDGTDIIIQSATSNKPTLMIKNTNTDGGAGELQFYKSTTSEGDGDAVGRINFYADNDAAQKTQYARIRAISQDMSDGTEDGRFEFSAMQNGTLTGLMEVGYDGNGTSLNLYTEGAGNTGLGALHAPDNANFYLTFGSDLSYNEPVSGDRVEPPMIFRSGSPNPNVDGGGDSQLFIQSQDDLVLMSGRYSINAAGNDIVFKTSNAAHNQTTEKMRILGDGKVGIGTTGPNKTLDVKGDAIIEGDLTISGTSKVILGGTGEYIYADGNDVRIHASDHLVLDAEDQVTVRASDFAWETDAAAEKMRFDADNGRLGIMTNSPNQALDVKGNAVLGESASSTVTVSGSVGIGTTPSYPLHINHTAGAYSAYITNTNSRGIRFGDTSANGTGYGKIEGLGGSLFLGSTQIYTSFIPTGDANAYLGQANRRWSYSHFRYGQFGYSSGQDEDTGAGGYVLAVSGNSDRHPFMVKAFEKTTPNFIVASGGNVGIGTKEPRGYFEIRSSADDDPTFRLTNSRAGASGSLVLQHRGSSIKIKAENDQPMGFVMGSTEVMTINSDDTVGIGTVGPNAKLDVRGTTLFGGNSITSGTSTIRAETHNPVEVRGEAGYGANIKYVRNNGSYGFFAGMLDNASRFDIAGNGGASEIIASFTTDKRLGVNQDGPNQTLDVKGNVVLGESTSSTLIVSGAVGVGTTSPASYSDKFSIKGTSANGWPLGITNSDDSVKGAFRTDATDNYFAMATKTASDIRFFYNDAEANTALIIKGAGATAGNVGIGTTGPNAPLDVLNTATQQRWSYNGSYYADMTVESDGDTTLYARQGALNLKAPSAKTIRLDSSGDIMADLGGNSGTYLFKVVDSSVNWLFTVHDDGLAGLHGADSALEIKERASAPAHTAAYGKLWVKNDAPANLYFTDDADNDIALTDNGSAAGGGGGSPGGSDTQIQFNNGGAFGGVSGFTTTDDGSDVTLTSATASKPVFTIENTNADNNPPGIKFFKNTASPASSDQIGSIKFDSKEATSGDTKTYWEIQSRINDATNTTANGQLNFYGLDGDSPGFLHQFQFINSQFSVLDSNGIGPTISPTGTNGGTFKTAGSKMRLQAKSDGTGEIHMIANYVGVGHTSPSELFHVQSANNTLALFKSTDNRGLIQVADDDTTISLVAEGTKASLGTVAGLNTANITIDNVGNLGVGEINPAFKVDVQGGSIRAQVAPVTYVYDIHAGFVQAAILEPNAGNIALISPDPGTAPAGAPIPVYLPDSAAATVGFEITIVQNTAADPGAALTVQPAIGSGDSIYEGGSNSVSSTVTIAANRGANKTFINVATNIWVLKE